MDDRESIRIIDDHKIGEMIVNTINAYSFKIAQMQDDMAKLSKEQTRICETFGVGTVTEGTLSRTVGRIEAMREDIRVCMATRQMLQNASDRHAWFQTR